MKHTLHGDIRATFNSLRQPYGADRFCIDFTRNLKNY